MTPQEIEKAAEKYATDKRLVIPFTQQKYDSFISGANLVMERVRKLEEALKRISKMSHDSHEDSFADICNCSVGIARAALEGKDGAS